MPRRRAAIKRSILPDPKFKDLLVSKFINSLMKHGKKSIAERIFYGALDEVAENESEMSPLETFKAAIENVMPSVEVKSRRVGGSTYQVPMEVRHSRSQSLAIRWLIENANSRSGLSMRTKLAAEIMDASNSKGSAIKKKEDTHKMAEANKAFAHYRW
ncbi:MAG: 30S ribosomal protein S7 [SAR324 cluster bacterium]|nr:30S ribosomal protein S7 [SAR324 cluster bacterium]MBL7034191.1 30S ribosomal protein S7 [SAR324 cluster bacterium]